jgi:hypothetical protein
MDQTTLDALAGFPELRLLGMEFQASISRLSKRGFASGFNDPCGDSLCCEKPRGLFRTFLSRGTISFTD